MARSLDFDDCEEETGYHAGFAVVPAALAAAETSTGATGADFLVAVAVASDTILRIRRATPLRAGNRMPWTSGTFAPISAAFAAGRALRLPEDTFLNAVGIAFTELSGTSQSVLDAAQANSIHQGTGVQAGLTAVALARRGITGVRNVLEGRFGLYNVYHLASMIAISYWRIRQGKPYRRGECQVYHAVTESWRRTGNCGATGGRRRSG